MHVVVYDRFVGPSLTAMAKDATVVILNMT